MFSLFCFAIATVGSPLSHTLDWHERTKARSYQASYQAPSNPKANSQALINHRIKRSRLAYKIISNLTKQSHRNLNTTTELFNKLEAQTKIPKAGIFTGGAIAACAVVYAIFGPGLLCNLAGFVYPAYASFKAIESFEKEDDTQW